MSENLETFLVVIHPAHENHVALERAVRSAGLRDAAPLLKLFISPDVELMRRVERDNGVCMSQDEFTTLQNRISEAGLSFTYEFHWTRDIENRLIATSETSDADMLFYPFEGKAVRKHSWFTTAKWDLLRKCRCPVMLVRSDQNPARRSILAAVNVQTTLPEYEALNRRIISRARRLAEAYGANITIMNAYENLSDYPDVEKIKKLSGLSDPDLIIVSGEVADAAGKAAEQVEADLVIIGTRNNRDIDALFRGNTAERVARRVSCDVLIVT